MLVPAPTVGEKRAAYAKRIFALNKGQDTVGVYNLLNSTWNSRASFNPHGLQNLDSSTLIPEYEEEELNRVPSSTPPTEVCLFQAGITRTTKGLFLFDELSGTSVMTKFTAYGLDKLPFDYGHGMVGMGLNPGQDSQVAAAWFVPEVRNGSLYATNIEWTESAFKAIEAKEWRFYSPSFFIDNEPIKVDADSGVYAYRVLELTNVALTNLPAIMNQTPLVNSRLTATATQSKELPKENHMDELVKLLGAASHTAALAQVHIMLGQLKTLEEERQALLSATGAKSVPEALAVVANVRIQLDKVQLDRETEQKTQIIQSLSRDGKLQPAMHAWAQKQSLSTLKEMGELIVAVVNTDPVKATELSTPTVVLSAQEIEMARQMGLSHDKLLANKIKRLQKAGK